MIRIIMLVKEIIMIIILPFDSVLSDYLSYDKEKSAISKPIKKN